MGKIRSFSLIIGVAQAWAAMLTSAALTLSACSTNAPPRTPSVAAVAAPNTAAASATLRLTYLGAAGWSVTSGSQTLLLDPYFTRVDVADPAQPLLPDQAAIARYAPSHAEYILVGHSHYDHLLDVPSIAAHTQATVVGSPSTLSVARAAGIPEAHLRLAVPGKDLRLGEFLVRPLASLHSNTGEQFGTISAQVTLPLASKDYQEGTTLAYLVSVTGHSIVFLDSANFDESALSGVHADIAVIATALREKIPQYTCRVLKALGQPNVVLPNHFDAHWQPFQARETRIEPEQRDDLAKFTAEVAACAPTTRVIVPRTFEILSL